MLNRAKGRRKGPAVIASQVGMGARKEAGGVRGQAGTEDGRGRMMLRSLVSRSTACGWALRAWRRSGSHSVTAGCPRKDFNK